MNKTVDTHICEVTVYDGQALVTRRGVVQLTGEEHELVIAQLPGTLLNESVRAKSAGMVAVQVLGVRTERNNSTGVLTEKIAQLTQEIEELEEQKRYGQDQLTILNLQRNFIKNLNTQYMERLTSLQNSEQISLNQIRELLGFVGEQYSKFSNAIAQQDKEQQQLDKQLQALHQQLQQLSMPRPQESLSIIVSLEPSAAGEFELEVSYLVSQASWVPLYDLYFDHKSENVNISYSAQVKQNSGEDWRDVALTLSTAKPGIGTLPPKLPPWYIDVQHLSHSGQRPKTVAEASSIPSRALSYTMPFPGMTPASEAVVDTELERLTAQIATPEVSKQGNIVTFRVSSGSNIPSDGAPHKTTIFNKDYSYRVKYIAMPKLVSFAYLQTTITNLLTGVTLLPGKANIFRDNVFLGTTQLENVAPGQEFKLNLSIDEKLKIDRALVERQVDNKNSNQRCTTYAYRLLITNSLEQEAKLTLTEQLPVTRHEQIKVCLTQSNQEIQVGEMGMLEWSLILPPLSKQELYYQFTVEHPPELTVVGLNI